MLLGIASDHAGYELKEELKKMLSEVEFIDFGPVRAESVDYPDFAIKACEAVRDGLCNSAVLICGTGIGMSITANKVKSIRAALCHCTDYAKMCKAHNDSNVMCIGARFVSKHLAKSMIESWLQTDFESGRHTRRINIIKEYELRGE